MFTNDWGTTSYLFFAKSSECEFVSKALRLFNSQCSGRFVVAQHGVRPASLRGSGAGGLDYPAPTRLDGRRSQWIAPSPDRTAKMGFFVASGFIRFGSESRLASRRYPAESMRDFPLTGTMSHTGCYREPLVRQAKLGVFCKVKVLTEQGLTSHSYRVLQ
jgi:hypothetical protein